MHRNRTASVFVAVISLALLSGVVCGGVADMKRADAQRAVRQFRQSVSRAESERNARISSAVQTLVKELERLRNESAADGRNDEVAQFQAMIQRYRPEARRQPEPRDRLAQALVGTTWSTSGAWKEFRFESEVVHNAGGASVWAALDGEWIVAKSTGWMSSLQFNLDRNTVRGCDNGQIGARQWSGRRSGGSASLTGGARTAIEVFEAAQASAHRDFSQAVDAALNSLLAELEAVRERASKAKQFEQVVEIQAALDGLKNGSDELLALHRESARDRLASEILGTTWELPPASGWRELTFQSNAVLHVVPDEPHKWVALDERFVAIVGQKVLLLRFDDDRTTFDTFVMRQPAGVWNGSRVK
jgi:hypothetical protein